MALARDIEKKFRKKRRSKTADFSELLRINVPQEDVENEEEYEERNKEENVKGGIVQNTTEKEEPDESF